MRDTTRRTTFRAALLAALALGLIPGGAPAEEAPRKPLKLVIGSQDAAFPEIVAASGVLDGTPYQVEWAVLPGPAAQLSGLYSKALDVGLMGDTSLVIEQGKASTVWTAENFPLQIVAGWRNPDPASFPPIVTVVRRSAGIKTLADLRGKRWAYNFGGFTYLQYVLSRLKAGLTVRDIEPVQLGDGNVSAAAFNSGQVDVYSGGLGPVKDAVDKGDAEIILRSDDLDIPALTVFTARGDVVRDPEKSAALADFLARLRRQWAWYAGHVDDVTRIYADRIKQAPRRARFSAENGLSVFAPLDETLIRREQRIADTLAASGDIPRKIDVTIEFGRRFNVATVP